ncbi:putative protein isoform X1 [Capsicum annuum]|uniref:uncharacterized protein LOC107842367 isoform X1 n=1 Tax=Capsicum annuum TaxID=4072 RepID=UPI0007BEB0E8|nr:uncharacterized protein LOC107842367 isoform X1 [Capsicum annuum]XP_016541662.1 uncharacterized protein LOC107842367 isoform X1 [Capsicum annuum]XP_016541670.1 uncharacterized protein LOC107842367 isoform X1 [Capsicum annuum]XP_016541680.1 uncharacterized protein LOC107842367 isoform X1 [Capsicum annuum]XP_047263975.1 uncharacterized protein LOC107842367 isoform X1 [Capsicum annuum]
MATITTATSRIGILWNNLEAPKHHFFNTCTNLSFSISIPNFKFSSVTMPPNSFRANASSGIDAPSEELEASSRGGIGANDLLIVGPGVLGRLVAERWRQEYPGCQIFGQTMTTDHHDELIKMGINPSSRETKFLSKFPYVIYCAPPSRTEDYPGDIRDASLRWSGEGSFLFTSSSAPYDCSDNGPVDEDGPIVPVGRSPRTDILLKAEQVVLEFGGCVVRLAGLYKEDRGAHTYWLHKGTVDFRPDHILNLIHYEDAASLSVTILEKQFRSQIFLGCDNHPLSRQELMDLVNKSGKFEKKFEGFTGTNGPLGKKLNNSKTRAELGWEPKYPSFAQFLGVSD